MYKGFFKKWNLFLKNFELSDYCDCILYIHKGQGKVTPKSHGKYLAFELYMQHCESEYFLRKKT
jgi:hypothetical protein